MGKLLSLPLAMTARLISQAQTKAPNDAELNAATQKIYERLCETQVTENRGDPLPQQNVSSANDPGPPAKLTPYTWTSKATMGSFHNPASSKFPSTGKTELPHAANT